MQYSWYIIALSLLALFAFKSKEMNVSRKYPLIGNWAATYDTLKINITFTANTGSVNYLNAKKSYRFSYVFKNDTVIKMWIGKLKPEYHVVRKLTSDKLLLRPYPDKPYREDINIIDAVDFRRVK